jgi:NAD(P)-dependent dehydrogenase (short-subunit alcohol dehydrogenase family)
MEISGKVVVVTGAASGIGRAMARRFHAEGAQAVAILDRDPAGAHLVAQELNALRPESALAIAGNVDRTEEVVGAIDAVEARFGMIDLYCANAGVSLGTDLETNDEDWDLAFAINVKAHYFAARRLVPGWVDRGHGYFLTTASAAGLLSQIGSAPYSVTKHAAVGFAEWLSITYGDRGVRVSCLCPQGVNTNMLNSGIASAGASAVRAGGAVLEPEDVASVVVEGLRNEQFLILPHPEALTYWQRKTNDNERWLSGMRKLQARVQGA